jgi:hypothetical protein
MVRGRLCYGYCRACRCYLRGGSESVALGAAASFEAFNSASRLAMASVTPSGHNDFAIFLAEWHFRRVAIVLLVTVPVVGRLRVSGHWPGRFVVYVLHRGIGALDPIRSTFSDFADGSVGK